MTLQEEIDAILEESRHIPFHIHNGINVLSFDGENSVVEAVLTPNSVNNLGIAHGGLVYSLADVAGGVCAKCLIPPLSVTQSGNLFFLRPGTGNRLIGKGSVVKRGRSFTVVDVNIYDENDVLVAHGTYNYANIHKIPKEEK